MTAKPGDRPAAALQRHRNLKLSEFDRDILERQVKLPETTFLFTLDQIATMMNLSDKEVQRVIYFQGRSIGTRDRHRLVAVDIEPDPNNPPLWRVSEREFRRYLRARGIKTS